MEQLPAAQILNVLEQALPQAALLNGETIVIVLTGSVLANMELLQAAIQDIVFLRQIGVYPIVVHGDDTLIDKTLAASGLIATWQAHNEQPQAGQSRWQSKSDVSQMVLSGLINKQLAGLCNLQGGTGLGISGRDANLMSAKKKRRVQRIADSNVEAIIDHLAEGEIASLNPDLLMVLEETEVIPFIAALAPGEKHEMLYLCPRDCGGKLSSALVADKLMIFGEAPFTLDGAEVRNLSVAETVELCEENPAKVGNFLLSLQIASQAVLTHTGMVYLLNGQTPHSLLLALFSDAGSDTCIRYE